MSNRGKAYFRRAAASLVLHLSNLHRLSLTMLFGIVGPRIAYQITGLGAGLLYQLLPPVRRRSEAQCRLALTGFVSVDEVPGIARESFVNRAKNLTDLMLASRFARASNYTECGGQIPQPHLSTILDAKRRSQPIIFLTAYFGSFDLLPLFLGYNGVHASVIYLSHPNVQFDKLRRRVRGQSGCEMIPTQNAARVEQILSQGGAIALLADHHLEGHRGLSASFLGLPTKVSRSVGLLASYYEADVVVGGIIRHSDDFQFRWIVADVIQAEDINTQPDPVRYVTERYLNAFERMIRENPVQYLWAYARWGDAIANEATSEVDDLSNMDKSRASAPTRRVGDRQAKIDGGTDNVPTTG